MDEKKADYYRQASLDFFAPVTEGCPVIDRSDGQRFLTANLLSDMRQALSHILIACDYGARVLEEDFFDYDNPITALMQVGVPDDCINRVEIVDNLLKGYYKTNIPTVFMSRGQEEIANLKKVLLQSEMQTLSTLNYKFGEVTVNKQVLVRDIKESIGVALKSSWLPHAIGAATLGLSYVAGLGSIQDSVLALLAGGGATALSKINWKEYVPPIQEPPAWFSLGNSDNLVFSSQTFNDEIRLPNFRGIN